MVVVELNERTPDERRPGLRQIMTGQANFNPSLLFHRKQRLVLKKKVLFGEVYEAIEMNVRLKILIVIFCN